MAPPPAAPGAPAGDLAPPPGDAAAPPPAPAPAPAAAAPAPAPTDASLAAPPADKLFPDKAAAASDDGGKKLTHYTVSHHDSLWKIAGKKRVYGDSFQWPLIFIANKEKIKDPDVIKPGESLKISREVGNDQLADAVKKAKDTPRFEPHSEPREKLPIEY